jgi:hypothetical protein
MKYSIYKIEMDASDTTRKRKAQAWYYAQKLTLAKEQPSADCFTNTCTVPGTCKLHFSTYDAKYNYWIGKNACNGCTCKINGGGR